MADGEQVVVAGITMATEAMKLLATAIGKFLEEVLRRSSAEYNRQIELWKQQKITTKDLKEKTFANNLETSASGRISDHDFVRSQRQGVEWSAVPVSLSKEELKEFTKIAEKNGMAFHAVMRTDYDGKNPIYYLSFMNKDLLKIDDAFKTLQFERKLRNLDAEITKYNKEIVECQQEIEACREYTSYMQDITLGVLSNEELVNIQPRLNEIETKYGIHSMEQAQEHIIKCSSTITKDNEVIRVLESEKAKIVLERKKSEINLCNEAIIGKAFDKTSGNGNGKSPINLNKDTGEHTTFNSAVNRDTSGGSERLVYICDTANPDHYIIAESKDAVFNGDRYLKTDYFVYDGKDMVMQCNDERFEGRTYADWCKTRSSMKASLNFSDNVIVFRSEKELAQYQTRCRNAKAVTEQEKGTPAIIDMNEDGTIDYRDYSVIIKNIKQSALDRGYTIEVGQEPIQTSTGRSAELVYESEKSVDAAICQNLSNQIEVYNKLWNVEYEMVMLETTLLSVPEGSMEFEEQMSKMESLRSERNDLLKQEQVLSEQRTSIENANIAMEMTEEQENSVTNERGGISLEKEPMTENELDMDSPENAQKGSRNMSIDEVESVFTEKANAIKAAKEAHTPIERTAAVSHSGR